MGRKSATPRKRKRNLASDLSDRNRSRVTSKVLSERLEQLVRVHSGGSRTAFAQLLGVGTSHISRWIDHRVEPGAAKLRIIATVTGVSVDWLLGFDVPPARDSRTETGDLAHALYRRLRSGAPLFAPLYLLGDEGELATVPGQPQSLVDNVAAGWWELRRQQLSVLYGRALSNLADRLEDDSGSVADPRVGTFMRQQAADLRQRAALLKHLELGWRELSRLRPEPLCAEVPVATAVALRHRDQSAIAYLEAPFLALGGASGVGIAWHRDATHDEAWFIDPHTLAVRHELGPPFLRELTIFDRFGEFYEEGEVVKPGTTG